MRNYIPATLEEIESRLVDNPQGIDGLWTGWLMPVKILSTRAGTRIKNNVLIKPENGLKERWESVKGLWLPVETLKNEAV